MPEQKILFVDIMGSGTEAGHLPVEIGWCDARGQGESHHIKPVPSSEASSLALGTPLRTASDQPGHCGKTVTEVAREVAEVLARGKVLALSDSPTQDQLWLDTLLRAGGVNGAVHLEPLLNNILGASTYELLRDGIPAWPWLDTLRNILNVVEKAAAEQPPQSALEGAQRNAAIWQDAMRRIHQARAARKTNPSGDPSSD